MSDDRLEPDPALAAFCADASKRLDATLSRAWEGPDVAAIVQRAHELDAAVVPEQMVRDAAALAPVVPIDPSQEESLAPFTGPARAELERRFEAAPEPAPRRPSRVIPAIAAVVGIAAAVVLAVRLVDGDVATKDDEPAREQAFRDGHKQATDGVAAQRQGSARAHPTPGRKPEVQPPVQPDTAPPDTAPHEEEVIVIEEDSGPTHRPPSLSDLDRRAQDLWKQGDVMGAERLFRKIVARGATSRRAELAYGDLFAIARQAHGPRAQAKLWQAYLRRFPKGRFAQDARAGLCRNASTGAETQCWRRYLERHPRGSYAGEARAKLRDAP